jgi:trigger factor
LTENEPKAPPAGPQQDAAEEVDSAPQATEEDPVEEPQAAAEEASGEAEASVAEEAPEQAEAPAAEEAPEQAETPDEAPDADEDPEQAATEETSEEEPEQAETPDEAPDADEDPEQAATEETSEEEPEKVPYDLVETSSKEGSIAIHKVTIPRDAYDSETERLYKDLSSSVTIEGFRRGKAPRKLLQIRFGKEVQKDALDRLSENIAAQLVEDQKIEPLSDPVVAESTVEDDKDLELTIEVEVRPKLEIKPIEGMQVEIAKREVTPEAVEERLGQLREANAQYTTAPESARFNPGDGAVIDYTVVDKQGQPLQRLSRKDSFERDLSARVAPELAEKLPGARIGQTVVAQIESKHQTRRGEERTSVDTHQLTLKEIKIRELPELDNEFAKDLGEFDSLKELSEHVAKELETAAKRQNREEILSKVYDKILEANPFDAPKSVVERSAVDMLGGAAQRLAAFGMRFQDLDEETQERYMESSRAEAERMVKINFVLNAIAEAQDIEVSDVDLDKAIERMAEEEGRRPLAIRARLERERRLEGLRSDLLVERVNDFLVSNATVTAVEAPEPEYEDLSALGTGDPLGESALRQSREAERKQREEQEQEKEKEEPQ